MTLLDYMWRGPTPELPRDERRSVVTSVPPRTEERAAPATTKTTASINVSTPKPARTDWNPRKAIKEGLKTCSWVYVCVDKRKNAASSVPWRAQMRKGGKWVWIDGEQPDMARLVEDKPSPEHSRQDVIEQMAMGLDLTGETYLRKIIGAGRTRKQPVGLWPMLPGSIEPRVDAQDESSILGFSRPRGWRGKRGGKREWTREEIIFGRYFDPSSYTRGLSPLKAAGLAVDTDNDAAITNRSVMRNAHHPSGVLGIKGKANDTVVAQLMKDIENGAHAGPSNRGKLHVLGADVTLQRFGMSLDDLMTLGVRGMTREEICAIYSVPPPVAGLFENANRANSFAAFQMFWWLAVLPLLEVLAGILNKDLPSDFGETDVRLMYDVSGIRWLRHLDEKTVRSAVNLIRAGWSLERVNKRLDLGFEPQTGDEIAWMTTNMTPVHMLLAGNNSPTGAT